MNDRLADIAAGTPVGLFLGLSLAEWNEVTNILLGIAGIVSAIAATVYYVTHTKRAKKDGN
jgi:hypothetical protein